MNKFKEMLLEGTSVLNEVKISKGQGMKYLGIIKQYLKSKKMDIETNGNIMEVHYDDISIIFKDLYLVGFKEGEDYYEAKNLRSIKDLKNIKEFQKAFGKKVKSAKDLSIPKEPIYNYFPESKDELINLIKELIKERGYKADLNDIDVSNVTDMSNIFYNSSFDGDISKWNVSKVTTMRGMFTHSNFNGNISKWNVSNVRDMYRMFAGSPLDGKEPSWYKK